jgi:PAS domain S-box-containing protein
METLKLLESLFDAIPDVIGIQDRHHGIIRYNAAGYKFLNMTHKEIEGKKCYELIGRNTPCDICATTECYKTKKPTQVEKYVEEMDVWLDVRAYPILDENGKIVNVIEHLRDITERKQIDMRLLMLERAVEQSIDGIAVADMDGFNKFVNPAWARMHGYSVEELTGEHLSRFHPKEQLLEKVTPFLDRVMKAGSHQGEGEHTKKDGTIFPTWMMVNLIKDEWGNPVGMVGTARDITEQKRTEKELQKYRDHLEELVKARTSKLTTANKQLKQALSEIQNLKNRLEAENINLREEIKLEHNFEEIIGQSDPLKYVLYKIEEVAPTDSTILILGQTGTGKELFARAIHNNSSRKSRPQTLSKVSCSATKEELLAGPFNNGKDVLRLPTVQPCFSMR